MARNISTTSLATIATKKGIEPVNIITINWGNFGTFFYYSDRRVPEEPGLGGKVLSINAIESVLNITGNSSSVNVNVVLDDTDGSIKNIINNVDIHKNQVVIYQWFRGIPLSDAFILFEGQIASPISWKEGDRTVSFDIVSKLYDNEVGFSPDDGNFINVPQELETNPWPLPFGTVLNLKPVQIDLIPSGATIQPLGIRDSGLTQSGTMIDCNIGKQLAIASCLSRFGAKLQAQGDLGGAGREIFDKGTQFQQRSTDILRQVATQSAKERGRVSGVQAEQGSFDLRNFTVLNGHRFFQNQVISVRVGKIIYAGIMNGDSFSVINRRPYNDPFAGTPPGAAVTDFGSASGGESINVPIEDPISTFLEDALFGNNDPDAFITSTPQERKEDPCGPHNLILPSCGNGSSSSKSGAAFYGQGQKQGTIFEQAGASVTVWDNYPIRYVVSILAGTEVIGVAAYIHDGGVKRLVAVPPAFYTISTVDYGGGVVATIVTVRAPLSQIDTSMLASQESSNNNLIGGVSTVSFEDDLYVTVQSPIGPNVADILQYLIQTYSPNIAIDAASFAQAHIDLTPYPANFVLTQKKNLIDVLKEIAFQAMCALWVSNNTAYIKFLPKQGPLVETFTESDIEDKSLELTTDSTENLVTKFVAEWQQDYAVGAKNKLILKANIAKYGLIEQTYDFYIYNNEESVKIASTFWLVRKCNTFKILKFKTFIHKLKVETLDDITLNFTNNYVANAAVPGVVRLASFDSVDMSISMEVWVPVRLGEMVLYNNALPVTYEDVYPAKIDELAGNAGSLPPSAHAGGDLSPGSVNFNIVRTNRNKGSSRPADPTFVAPTPGSIIDKVGAAGTKSAPGSSKTTDFAATGIKKLDYTIPSPIASLPRPKITTNNSVFPGKILGFAGTNDDGDQQYNVKGWPNGFANDPVFINVAQLQLDGNDTIPNETWVLVARQTIITDQGSGSDPDIKVVHSMQVPVWLKEPDSM